MKIKAKMCCKKIQTLVQDLFSLKWGLLSLMFIFCVSCNKKEDVAPLFRLLKAESTGVYFENTIQNEKGFNIFSYRNFYNGGGVAIGDINGDGLPDIYFTANMGPNKLYLNKGGLQFEDITDKAGVASLEFWSTGVSMVDINCDGLLDIYVCNAGFKKGADLPKNQLYINNGDLTFTESAKAYNLDDSGYTTHAAFFDYDGDGLLDCYILNNSFIPVNTLNYSNKRELRAEDWPVNDFLKGGGDKLMKNTGNGFLDVTEDAGIYSSLIGFGLGVTVGDVNNDGWLDIYVSNDFFERDYLYINQQDGTFIEQLCNQMGHTSQASMGADMADINNSGWMDIFVTDMLPYEDYRLKTTTDFENYDVYQYKQQQGFFHQFTQNTLQINGGNGQFREISYHAGVAASDWSWGALILDADADGHQDILVCNGIYHDVIDQDFIDFFANDIIQKMTLSGKKEELDSVINKMPSIPVRNCFFKNQGNHTFQNMASVWGLGDLTFSNGAAYADLDGDGDLDIVINNVNQPSFIYENLTNEQDQFNYLSLELKGDSLNNWAIGSRVTLHCGEDVFMRELVPNRGFQSSIDFLINIGLGAHNIVDSIHIIWHDRTITKINTATPSNQRISYDYLLLDRKIYDSNENANQVTWLEKIPLKLEAHQEDQHIDFDYEKNLPMLLSQEGPPLIIGDLNNDGISDIIIGGARGQPTQVYLGKEDQTFTPTEAGDLTLFKEFEDTAITLFDANGDGLLDVFIGSGGNFLPPNTREMQDRLYLNEGNMRFKLKTDAFPNNGMNTSIALPIDINGDGILDLFVGSRSFPLEYGTIPRSYFYQNDGKGKFADVTAQTAPIIEYIGMITDAVYTDLDGDAQKELIIVGEWMSPIIIKKNKETWTKVSIPSLDPLKGWWYSVAVSDLDLDGYPDIILGNRGTNGYLGSRDDLPIKLYYHDFDKNQTKDILLTRSMGGRDVPVVMKKDLTSALPSLKKTSLTHKQYALKSIHELFNKETMKGVVPLEVNYIASIIAFNDGNNQYSIKDLPVQMQWSSIYSIVCEDINGDGLPEIITGGNHFAYPTQFSRLDANLLEIAQNKGNRAFKIVSDGKKGVSIRAQIRSMIAADWNQKRSLLVGINNQSPQLIGIRFTSD
jgi:hypothetical protein